MFGFQCEKLNIFFFKSQMYKETRKALASHIFTVVKVEMKLSNVYFGIFF